MKTLLAYTTKHGSTKTCTDLIHQQLTGDVTIINIKTDQIPDLIPFDAIMLGGSIYAGKTQKELRKFAETHLAALLEKPVFLFFCCGLESPKYFQENFPDTLSQHASVKTLLGTDGKVNGMNFVEKLIMKVVSKTQPTLLLQHDRIAELAGAVNAIGRKS